MKLMFKGQIQQDAHDTINERQSNILFSALFLQYSCRANQAAA